MKKHWNIAFFSVVICFTATIAMAQEDMEAQMNDDLGNVSDAFQENFFEALKQKGIENYELALNALQKAERAAKKDPELEAVVYYERGKNLFALKRYEEAEANYQKVLLTKIDKIEVLEALYDVYYEERDYEAAIQLVLKLSKIEDDYKEDLASLYSRNKQYDKALELLDELDESWGESLYRDSLRRQIYQVTGNSEGAIKKLESKIEANSKNEKDYLNLIYLYSEEGNSQKAFETAQELLKNHPTSTKAHLALYKFYLDSGETEKAIVSIKKVFTATDIENESKYKMLSDFLGFVAQNPSYEKELETIIPFLEKGQSGNFYEQLGSYFVVQKKKSMALRFYEKGASLDSDNFSLIKNTVLLQIDTGMFEEAVQLSKNSLAIFPAQALLYLLNGVAHNELGDFKGAVESLEMGLDFLLDDPKMEKDFYEQLSKAYTNLGDLKKAATYQQRAAAVQISN